MKNTVKTKYSNSVLLFNNKIIDNKRLTINNCLLSLPSEKTNLNGRK